jgi:LacI family transcriptional regulator
LVVSKAEHIRVDAFIPQTLYRLSQFCAEHGYRLLVETSDGGASPFDFEQLVGARQIDGLVVLNPDPQDERLTQLIEQRFPLVLIGAHPHAGGATVSVNSALAMERATAHLIGLGHERIGFIHYRAITNLGMGGRFKGYRVALERAGLSLEPRWVRSGDFSAESGYAAMGSLLSDPDRPTAVVMGNDTIAMGAMAAAVEKGLRIPEDIAIVGFDDIPLARYAIPALTTVRVPASEMASTGGEMILRLIRGAQLDTPKRVFDAELVIRRSCGVACAPAT